MKMDGEVLKSLGGLRHAHQGTWLLLAFLLEAWLTASATARGMPTVTISSMSDL